MSMSNTVGENPLDTLAEVTSVEAEETGNGAPKMPPAGVEGAAVKPTLELDQQEHQQQLPNGGAGEALHSENGLAGTGDAAMAAADSRLDTGELPHTNGYVSDAQDQQQGNEVDYGRVAALTGEESMGTGAGVGEKAPPMSMDIEQPADRQVDAQDPEPEKQGEAMEPAPGQTQTNGKAAAAEGDAMSLDNILSSADSGHAEQSSLVAREEPQANGQATEETDAHAPQEPSRPTSEFQQTVPEPASSLGQPSEQDVVSKLPTPATSQTLQADPSFTVTESSQPASQQPPASETAAPLSMDALPDAPAPLPSQLVNHSIPSVTDAQFDSSLPSTLDASEQQQAPPRSPFTSGEPTIPADAERVPPTNPQTMPEGSLPQSLASPSLAKRPFEPDTSNPDARDYFGDATEPQVKRQRMSPPVGDSAEAGSTSVEQQQLGTAAVEPSTGAAVGQPAQADADGEKDAEADAEADVDPAVHEPEIQFGTADMGEQPPLPPKLEAGDASMLDQSLDQSMGGGADSFSYESGLQQQGDYADSPMLPPTATTSTGTPADGDFKPPSLPSAPPAPAIMPKEQAKYALSMLRTLKRKSEAGPFLHPVDPVALNIPTYVDIITHPMDLGTVERKIQTGQYKDVDEFAGDMRLIWQNCITFNGPDNAVSIWAKTLSTLFEKQIQRMPTLAAIQAEQIAKRSQSPSDSKKSKSGGGSSKPRRPSQAGGSRLSESQRKQQTYEAEYDDYGAPSTSRPQSGGGGNKKKGKAPQQLQQHQMGMPMGGYGGPAMQNGNLNNEQLKFCKEVIKELFKKQHSAFAYPFYEPVDYMALGIPDYPKVIRRPMDLGTMKRKIESGQYPSAQAFEGDFKLLIQNCFTYNPPMTPVNKMGEQLQAVFYEKWQQLPQQDYNQGYGGGGYYGEENRYENEQIMLMQRQLELLTGNLEMLKSKAIMGGGGMGVGGYGPPGGMGGQRGMQMQMPMQMGMGMPQQSPYLPQQQQQQQHSPVNMMSPPLSAPAPPAPKPRPPPTQRAAPKPAPAKRKTSGSFSSSLPSASAQASAPPKPRTTKRSSMAGRADVDYAPPPRGGRGGDSDYEDEEIDANVTFDMKRELAEKIQEFDGPKLDKVVEIIRNSAPELLGDDNKEIELDIDMLDQRTLLKLYEYVVHPVGKGRQLKPKKNKVKGRNRGVDEVAEEERINALQAQLDAMSGNVANAAAAAGLPVPEMPMPTAGGRAADVASSSSEEDDDGSESESDGFAPSPQ